MNDMEYGLAIAYATDLGTEHGRNAASWVSIDEGNAATIRTGIEDGDPAIIDLLPFADLSGQHADALSGPSLFADAMDAAGVERDDQEDGDTFSEVCNAYEEAFHTAVTVEVERRVAIYLDAPAEDDAATAPEHPTTGGY